PLDGDTFRSALPDEQERKNLPDSIVVRTADGRLWTRGQAVLYILRRLGGLWRLLAGLAAVAPAPLLDRLYDGVAGIRYRLFRKREGVCPILPARLRERFDG